MLYIFKIGTKYPLDPNRGWRDGQLVDIRPTGYSIGKTERKHFFFIEDGQDYWQVRGDINWKSTRKKWLDFKKQFLVPDSNGKYPWEFGYLKDEETPRKRDWFADPKDLLDTSLITQSQFERIYNKDQDSEIIYLDRDPSTYIFHEVEKQRKPSDYSNIKGSVAAGTFQVGTGTGADYATWTTAEADVAATMTGHLTFEGQNQETAISSAVVWDTRTNSYLLKLTAEAGAEHNGGAYGSGARILLGTWDRMEFDETTDTYLARAEILKLAMNCSGDGNEGWYIDDCGATKISLNRLVVKGNADTYRGISLWYGAVNVDVFNCIVYGIGASAGEGGIAHIQLQDPGTHRIANCTIVGCREGIINEYATGSGAISWTNNLVQNCSTACYRDDGAGAMTRAKNVSEDATGDAGYTAKDLHTNTIFVDYTNNDYRLNPAGDATNLAIADDGDDLSGTFTDDVIGQTRSTWYVGAYEIVASGEELTQDLSDSISMTDLQISKPILNKSDSISMSDAYSMLFGINKPDSITLSDNIAKLLSTTKSDSISMSDVIDLVIIIITYKNLSDSISMSDSTALSFGLSKSDQISLSDIVSKNTGMNKADTVSMSDVLIKGIGVPKSDSISLSDDVLKSILLSRNDGITLSDTLSKQTGISKTDIISLSDSLIKLISILKTDSITLSEIIDLSIAGILYKNLTDTINMSDTRTASFELNKSDIINLSDIIIKQLELSKTDLVSLSDVVSKNTGLNRSDSISLSESLIKNIGLSKSDTITLSEIISIIGLIISYFYFGVDKDLY